MPARSRSLHFANLKNTPPRNSVPTLKFKELYAVYPLDPFLKSLIVSNKLVEAEIERLKLRDKIRGHKVGDEVWDYLDVIDAKASALLGHISIFAAVAGYLLSTTEEVSLFRTALTVEFISLLFLTFLCLRCLRIIVPSPNETSAETVYRSAVREMLYRRRVYVFVHAMSGLVTLAMIGTALLLYVA